MQDNVFSSNTVLKCVRLSQNPHEVPNQTMHSQTKPCIAKSVCEICVVQRTVVIRYRCFRTTYWSHLPMGQEIQKRTQSMTEVNCHKLLFWDFIHYLIF